MLGTTAYTMSHCRLFSNFDRVHHNATFLYNALFQELHHLPLQNAHLNHQHHLQTSQVGQDHFRQRITTSEHELSTIMYRMSSFNDMLVLFFQILVGAAQEQVSSFYTKHVCKIMYSAKIFLNYFKFD